MLGLNHDQFRHANFPTLISRFLISIISTITTHISLLTVPLFFPSLPLSFQLILSGVVFLGAVGLLQGCRKVIGVRASAPAFVYFNVVFIWVLYLLIIRQAVSPLMDILFNAEIILLQIGFSRILVSDPGFVRHDSPDVAGDEVYPQDPTFVARETHLQRSTDEASMLSRTRYCRSCKVNVRGFDHHCPAFGNCVGDKNYALFMVLLVGFIATEASYVTCCYQWIERQKTIDRGGSEILPYGSLAVSTMLFSLLQVLWQVVFVMWHLYCISYNIRTDEWINWKNYSEFHVVVQPYPVRFRNPYDKGIFGNWKDFLLTGIQG